MGERRSTGRTMALVAYWASAVVWMVGFAALLGYIGFERTYLEVDSWMQCSLDPATSFYGEAHWSWTELGTVCEYQTGSISFQIGPGLARWALVAVFTGWGASLALATVLLFSRRPSTTTSDDEPMPSGRPHQARWAVAES